MPEHESQENNFDWAAIYSRLEQTEKALESIWTPDEQRQRQRIDERNRRLEQAREELAQQIERPSLSIVEFRTAGRVFAIETAWVQRVQAPGELTPVPAVPRFIKG